MANYDVVKTVTAFYCDEISNLGGYNVNITGTVVPLAIPVYSYSGELMDFDFSRVTFLPDLFPLGKQLAIATKPNQSISDISGFFGALFEDIPEDSSNVDDLEFTLFTYTRGVSGINAYSASLKLGKCCLVQTPSGPVVLHDSSYLSYPYYVGNIFDNPDPNVTTLYSWEGLSLEKNLVLASPSTPIVMQRGTSIDFSFDVLGGGVEIRNAAVTYENSQPDALGTVNWTISGNTLTITPECWYSKLWIRFASVDYPDLKYEMEVTVTDPLNPPNPYVPPGGGSGGAGVPSGPGYSAGSFPTDPGPSLVDKIPNGSAGNDIAQSGLYTKYLLNKTYMDLLGDILWEDNIVINALKELFGNPIDAIISCMSYPFNLVNFVNRTNQDLFFGHIDTNLPFIAITKSSFQIDWGKIEIPFAWANFLDYSPYTKVELFLPWGPGYVTIDPNDIMPFSNIPGNFNVSTFVNGSIHVKTNIELDKGTCVHNVIGNNGRVIGSFSGIVGRSIPLTALDTAGKALSTIGAVAAVATAGASTAATAAGGGFNKIVHGSLAPINGGHGMAMKAYSVLDPSAMASGFGSNVANSSAPNMASRAAFNTPFAYPRAGTFSDGSAAMTIQEPFLIISRPVQSVPSQYGHYNGYPSNIYYDNFSSIRGYTEISEIHLDNIGATTDELDELDAIMKGGILL